jgi:hypothetical protein
MNYNEWIHHYRIQCYQNKNHYKKKVKQKILYSKKERVKLVRNPYKRAVSSFLHLVNYPVLKKEIGLSVYEGITFTQFLYRLDSIGVSLGQINPHFAEQYRKGEELFINQHIYLETFTDHIRDIENKYRLKPSPLERLTKSHHHAQDKMSTKGNFANFKFTKETLDQVVPDYSSFYNEETTELVNKLYKNDFKAYGYDSNKMLGLK